ncbi:hypothetical protein Tco_0939626, partial [Tanacetum coccineum]
MSTFSPPPPPLRDVIVVEEDHDVIHDNNSSYLAQSANLNDLDFATLNIDGQSTKVEAPPPIIPVDNADDFIDDEDDVPYDLSDSDNEMVAAVARGHDGEVSVTRLPPCARLVAVVEDREPEEERVGETRMEAGRACVKTGRIESSRKPWKITARGRLAVTGSIKKRSFMSAKTLCGS